MARKDNAEQSSNRSFADEIERLHRRIAELEARESRRGDSEASVGKSESRLRQSEARYREIFDDAPGALWIENWSQIKRKIDQLSDEGVSDWRAHFAAHRDHAVEAYDLAEVLQVSNANLDFYGATSVQELKESGGAELVLPGEIDAFIETMIGFIEGRWIGETESLDDRMDGAEITIHRRYVIPRANRHDWSRVIYSLEDVTDRKRAEEALLVAEQAASGANRSKPEFLANMSHELRTPLNAIMGFSEMIKSQVFGPVGNAKYLEYSSDIHDAGGHLLGLINDVLDLSKIEAGKLELTEASVNVAEAVRAAVTLIKPRAAEGEVSLTMRFPKNLPALIADERKLRQILINLLSNATKFTPPGGQVSARARTGNDGGTEIVVADNGVGMTPEGLSLALEAFGQVDSPMNRELEGTGLGLPITKALMELHDGSLDIEITPGSGTQVTLRFPPRRTVHSA